MTSPAAVACAADTWVKVATNVTRCRVDIKDLEPVYVYTYVDTSGAAPTTEATALRITDGHIIFDIAAAADIYVKAKGVAGSVVVSVGLIS